jgi:transposase
MRGELLERPFAHMYETGGMRRTHLRGHPNILKRLLIHSAGFNLGLLMRTLIGIGTPRGLQGALGALLALLKRLTTCLEPFGMTSWPGLLVTFRYSVRTEYER